MENSPIVPSIILDCLGIALCTLSTGMSLLVLVLLFVRRRQLKRKDQIPYLLSVNMYVCIMISALFIAEMYIAMLLGHLRPTTTSFDTFSCRFKGYVMYVFSISIFHSCAIQAFHRMTRIIHYSRPYLHRDIRLYYLAIALEIPVSGLQALPHLLWNKYSYVDYHCQVSLRSWSELLSAALLFWFVPGALIMSMYLRTMHRVRQYGATLARHRRKRIRRDATALARIFWLTAFIIFCGIPPCTLAIIYYISGYFGWWTNHFQWYTSVLSFIGVGLTHLFFTPHLHILWPQRTVRPIHPTVATISPTERHL